MQLLKCNFFFLIIILSYSHFSLGSTAFSDNECLESSYDATVSHKAFPFGLSSEGLSIKKENCIIDITLQKFKFFKNSWKIDVWREPVHIKEDGASGPEVLKKNGLCDKQRSNEFCSAWKKIQTAVQDDGLIFANGEKEDLGSEHGKVYCSYLLLKKYLDDEKIFSRHQIYVNVLIPQESTSNNNVSTTVNLPNSTASMPTTN